jgi:hypothetical protein
MRWRIAMLVATVVAVVLGLAAPASAKGADQATITGPGLSKPIVINGNGEPGSVEQLGQLSDGTGLFAYMFGGDNGSGQQLAAPPAGDLGPQYSIAYRVPDGSPNGSTFRQDLYPSAPNGPVTFTPDGQEVFGNKARTGWFQPAASFGSFLTAIGIPGVTAAGEPTASVSPTAPATRAALASSHSPGGMPVWLIAAIIGVAALLVLATVAWLGQRSRQRATAAHKAQQLGRTMELQHRR